MPCIFSQLDLFSEVSVEQYTSLTCDSGLGKAGGGRGEGCQLGLGKAGGERGAGCRLGDGCPPTRRLGRCPWGRGGGRWAWWERQEGAAHSQGLASGP